MEALRFALETPEFYSSPDPNKKAANSFMVMASAILFHGMPTVSRTLLIVGPDTRSIAVWGVLLC